MAVGQGVLGEAVLDVGAVDALTARIEAREIARSVQYAEQLLDVLALSRVWVDAGMSLGTEAHLALVLSCSERRAGALLHEARVLRRLDALRPMLAGLLTVEQARVVVDLLGPVDDSLAAALWTRLEARLLADRADGVVRPPARLRELLSRWLIAADPEAWAARRKAAGEADADVALWKRDDGLVDVIGRAFDPAEAIAMSDRIDAFAQALGPEDERSAGQRRRDVLRDLILGLVTLPFDQATGEVCCPPGSTAPCGAQIFIHVPLPAVLGETTEPAELSGHGPLDAAQLTALLANAPVLRRVWVDRNRVPVAVDDRIWTPGRDPAALQRALSELRTGPPPKPQRRAHPDPGAYVPPNN